MADTAPTTPTRNREAWLHAFADAVDPWFRAEGIEPTKRRLACGFPSKGALSQRRRVIGQCWPGIISADETHEIFISPMIHDTLEVAATVVHELIHAYIGCEAGHGPKFVKVMQKMLLEGKATATIGGAAFAERVKDILAELGSYPHVKMQPNSKLKSQSTRLVKCVCERCGYTVRTTRKWLDTVGEPLCPNEACYEEGEYSKLSEAE